MNYKEKVMAYADIINGGAPDMSELLDKLEQKIMYTIDDSERIAYWTEVRGRILRNGLVTDIEFMESIERYNMHNLHDYPDIASLVNSPNVLEWIKYLDKLEDEVWAVMDYQKDNMILAKPSERQSELLTIHGLSFFNTAIGEQKPFRELFKYIPLVVWSVDNLHSSKNLHPKFIPFLINSFLPLLRAHRQCVMELIELLDNEETELAKEKNQITLKQATVFNRDYEAEQVSISIPEAKMEGDRISVFDDYLCQFGIFLLRLDEGNSIDMSIRSDDNKKAWHFAPFTMMYKLKMHSDMLGVTDQYAPAIEPRIVKKMDDILHMHRKVYNEKNLLQSVTLAVEDLMSQAVRSEHKHLYEYNFREGYPDLEELVQAMVEKGLVTARGGRETLDRIKDTAKEIGIYSGE